MTSSAGEPETTQYQGWVSTYWEQGMEEMPWPIFQDERHVTGETGGWLHSGMRRLKAGDHLTLSDSQGSTVWSGELQPTKKGWFRALSPGSLEWHPPNVSPEQWQRWLAASPPMRAVLTTTRDPIPPPS